MFVLLFPSHDRVGWCNSPTWKREKDKIIKRIFGSVYTRRKEQVENVIGLGLATLQRCLLEVEKEGRTLNIKELSQLTGIISDVNKMLRLEEGKPTDIHKTINLKEAKRKIIDLAGSDPFGEFEDVIIEDEETDSA